MEPKCHVCGKPATKRVTNDIDIAGIPLCDDERCKHRLFAELWMELDKIQEQYEAHQKTVKEGQ